MSAKDEVLIRSARMFLNRDRWQECGRRVPRADIVPDLPVWIRLPELSDQHFTVKTIGELGAYCQCSPKDFAFVRDQVVELELKLQDHSYFLEGRIRYILTDGIALEFMNPDEPLRELIRMLFKPELLAVSLAPIVTYTGLEPGSAWTLIYSDGETNSVQVSLVNNCRIASFNMDLEVLDLRLSWRKGGELILESLSGGPARYEQLGRIASFVRNLQGMDQSLMKDLEAIITTGKPLPGSRTAA